MVNTVPVQSEKPQFPKQPRHLPPDPASSKGMPTQIRPSTPPVTEKWKSNATEPTSPYFTPAENETFMFATRHALEQALGKDTLGRLEELLQNEKKLTQDYIEYLEETVRQKSGVASPMLNTLVQKEIAHWKAKAESHSESTKTELGLLRDWNVRIKDKKDMLQEEVKRLREENSMLKAGTERQKETKENEKERDKEENKRLRTRNTQLEAEKDTLNANMQMMLEESVALKAEIERLKNGSAPAHKQEESDIEMKDSHDEIAGANKNAAATPGKNHEKNARKRAKVKKLRELIIVQENKQLSAKLAEAESQYANAQAATLAAHEELVRKLQEKIEELQREIRSRDEHAERQHHSPAPASTLMATSTDALKRKDKKDKKIKEKKKPKEGKKKKEKEKKTKKKKKDEDMSE
ncbi:uncharacterized protein yc1106_07062 [Curvularia clavata]|uniref:Uncharacterized protein n=1 Tax=Curvularia clavata TaxID=95742 RepID=A0A9Q8ZGJ5_CURCL|nr:uncharacterized protein yc1106_07062 [Curvularia clavata]